MVVLVTVSGVVCELFEIFIYFIGHFRPVLVPLCRIVRAASSRVFGDLRIMNELQDVSLKQRWHDYLFYLAHGKI